MWALRGAVSSAMFGRELISLNKPLLILLVGVGGGGGFALLASQGSPLLGVIAITGLLFLGLVLYYPMLGLYLTAAVIPMERLGRFTDDTSAVTFSLMRVIGLVTLCAFVTHAVLRRWRLRGDAAFNLYLAYWCFTLLALFFTSDLRGNLQATSSFLGNLLFLFLLLNMVRSWHHVRILVIIWLALSVVVGLYTIYDWHFGHSFGEALLGRTAERFSTVLVDTSEWDTLGAIRRAVGTTSNPAVYAINLIMTLPFFAWLYRCSRDWRARGLIGLGAAIVFYNILLTNTRAAILLSVLLAGIAVWRGLLRMTPAGLVVLCLGGVAMLPLLPGAIYERILDPSNYSVERSGTLSIRLQYWHAGLEVAAQHWLTGTGVGNTKVIADYVTGGEDNPFTVHTAHNEFITSFVEVGIFGWTILMAFLLLLLFYTSRAGRNYYSRAGPDERFWFMRACQLTLIGVLIYGLQVDVLHFPLKGFWLVAGLSCLMHRWSYGEDTGRMA